jgi:hypothetical protein
MGLFTTTDALFVLARVLEGEQPDLGPRSHVAVVSTRLE